MASSEGLYVSLRIAEPTVKTYHNKPYPGILPTRPELSQAGRTVLVAGGTTGIGYNIALSFIQASAAHVIVLSRRQSAVDKAVADLNAEAKSLNLPGKASGYAIDVSDRQANDKLWDDLQAQGVHVDVLSYNAAGITPFGPLIEADLDGVSKTMDLNAIALLQHAQRLYRQQGLGGEELGGKKHYIVNTTTSAIHRTDYEATGAPVYPMSKSAGLMMMNLVARDVDPSKLQIVSFNPGSIYTETAASAGYGPEMTYDDRTFFRSYSVVLGYDLTLT